MLDVRRLRLLRDLAHLGTIAAVARSHRYTPSAVSQQLALLQREAGVPLLEHTGRRVRLTSAGRALVRHTESVLASLEAASAALAAARTGLSGTVRIGAFPSAVRTLLPAALVALGRAHPWLDLMVSELDPAAMPDALRDNRLDVALLHDYDIVPAEADPTLDSTALLDERVFLAVPVRWDAGHARVTEGDRAGASEEDQAGAPVAGATSDPVAGACEADWIVASPGTLCHTVAVRSCQAAGFAPRVRHLVDDFTAVLALVAAGQGVALVPELGATPAPAGVRLLPLSTRRRTRVGYRRGAGAHPAVVACVEALHTAVAAPPGGGAHGAETTG